MKEKLNCILVIDDDEPTNFMSALLIEEANCTTHLEIAESGKEALTYLAHTRSIVYDKDGFDCPELVFLDINMPRMNGWQFLDEYKKLQNPHHAEPVIIVLTTSLDPSDRERAESIPEVTGYETKPLTSEMIQRVIETYFDAA